MFDGILLIDKEKGWTSHDVVAKVRSILTKEKHELHTARGFCMEMQRKDATRSAAAGGQAVRCKCRVKVGHTGTLDPLATGLMVVVVGNYCKRAQEFSKLDKVYEVEMKLGETSSTGDEEGQKTKISTHKPSLAEVSAAIEQFVGDIEQTPPAYSAIKVGGKRAYQLAREGKEVKLEPREVTIHQIKTIMYAYPIISFTAHVSSGTYIRSLVEDIGAKLDTSAYMTDLKRTKVGDFVIKDAINVTDVEPDKILTK